MTRDLVVYLPGIAGSRLCDPERGSGWSTASAPRTLFDPSRLDLDRRLVPVGLMPDQAVVQALPLVPRYRSLFRKLREQPLGATIDVARPGKPPNPSADFVAVPYDFRHSIKDSAEYLDRVVEEWRGDRRVIIVAHSMGGLVARYWISMLGGWRVCGRLLTWGPRIGVRLKPWPGWPD